MRRSSPGSGSKYWIDGFPELAREWDYERNGDLKPSEVSAGSGRRVWWICPRGPDHRWRAKPNNRTRGAGCPFCTNRRVSMTNSLATLFPNVAAEWDADLNGALRPYAVVATATRVVWWRCTRDARHVWRVTVRDRTRDLSGCPLCAGDRVCESNSLRTVHPAVAAEWHPTKNGALTPDLVTWGSSRRVWWRCASCGRAWCTSVTNRVSRASRCPACAGRSRAKKRGKKLT
jgi:DNA-directed RNA polymerase subunit RPC12/RpoP